MIRQAVPADVKKAIPLILQAIDDIAFVLSGTTDAGETELILSDFFRQPGNRLSYENCLVMEDGGEVVGIAILYDGVEAQNLNLPVEQAAAKKTGNAKYQIPIEPERIGVLSGRYRRKPKLPRTRVRHRINRSRLCSRPQTWPH